MKVLFITKPFFIEPLGIMHLVSAIQPRHQAMVITTDENIEQAIDTFKPDFLAYSIMTGDQNFYNSLNKRLINYINGRAVLSIAGGPHPTFFPEMIKESSFDFICRGEGEIAFRQLLDRLDRIIDMDSPFWNMVTKSAEASLLPLIDNLDFLPFPDRECVFKYEHIRNGPIKHFMAARGCPYNCTYCFNHAYTKLYKKCARIRFRSVDNVLQEIHKVIEQSPTKFIYFQDDTFILKPAWLREFADKYPKVTNLPFHCHTRANLVTESIVKDLKMAGCYSVHLAAESGSDEVKKEILKRCMTNDDIKRAMALFKKYDIKVMLQNILGLPFTTLADDFKTLELNIECQPDYAWASIFQPYPKTMLGERCRNEGVYTGDFSDINNNFFDSSVLNIPHKNQVSNLQKLFAIVVQNPELYTSGVLSALIEMPYKETREIFTYMYKMNRKKSDKILYGMEL